MERLRFHIALDAKLTPDSWRAASSRGVSFSDALNERLKAEQPRMAALTKGLILMNGVQGAPMRKAEVEFSLMHKIVVNNIELDANIALDVAKAARVHDVCISGYLNAFLRCTFKQGRSHKAA